MADDNVLGLKGEPALVVGGGYGIGRATSLLLARAGARVAVADVDPARARKVAEEVNGFAIAGDVLTPDGAKAVVDEAHKVLGGLTKVANIVGRANFAPFLDTGPKEWEEELRLNLWHQMYICHAAGKHMLAERGGAIVMVASVSGTWGAHNHLAYGAAKAGVMSVARSLSNEWAGRGVRINTVSPDIIATPRHVERTGRPEAEVFAEMDAAARAEGIPVGRFGRPEDIAGPVVFLLSDLSAFMTGQNLVSDGGTMALFPHAGVRAPTGPVVASKRS